MQRYFLKRTIDHEIINLTHADAAFNHFGRVLRARVGTKAEFVDSNQQLVIGQVTQIDANQISMAVIEHLNQIVEMPINVTVIVSPLKNDRSEWFVQKITELGATRIIFTEMARTVADWRKQQDKKIARLQKITQAAAEQSHRLIIPEIDFLTWETAIHLPKDKGIVAWEESAKEGEISAFIDAVNHVPNNGHLVLVFGPEGGLTVDEVQEMTQFDFVSAGLGPRILRAETAPLYALSAISVLRELQ
ncbi:16S rRNA (uracil(1498)-N(3))-methyltransferase [Leuconostoc falkenbergense]|uniref:RsmE family RNA methyltransferase n=1 Tax=Leuconostoc falkenbergense TaxID=2766470 RepID=UPI001669FA6C|nr:RsmE family RNA methyltransferase [Leuconostoc falkenbergense]MCT4403487.1 16S rRNA (uracil(1498)-N(3))-methyltransferase [Leuconostoc falkenbergense]